MKTSERLSRLGNHLGDAIANMADADTALDLAVKRANRRRHAVESAQVLLRAASRACSKVLDKLDDERGGGCV